MNTTTTSLALPPPRLTLIDELKTAKLTPKTGARLHKKFFAAVDYNLTLGRDFFRRNDINIGEAWEQYLMRLGTKMVDMEVYR